jgi:putative oxidoreductase
MKKLLFYNQPIAYELGLNSLRIFTGFLMLLHGIEVFNSQLIAQYATWDSIKILPYPLLMAYLGKGLEFIGGLLLLLGLMTRLASLIIIIDMLFICFRIGQGRFWYEDQHPFLFVLLALFFVFAGAGKYSLDELISKKA